MEKNVQDSLVWGAEETVLGWIAVGVSASGLARVEFSDVANGMVHSEGLSLVNEALQQIHAYLAGDLKKFDLPLDWSGMGEFQKSVLKQTILIPYGQVITYGDIANILGKPGSARAVGRAEATNPMPLVIPCHRVIGQDGHLHGYGGRGGIITKAWLLKMEGVLLDNDRFLIQPRFSF